ncbi:hypothetical protein J1614_008240 [Plenodomus biglobosus]|nr:hypothetical protein J1614_008240 [Plenodomus biglobosus]
MSDFRRFEEPFVDHRLRSTLVVVKAPPQKLILNQEQPVTAPMMVNPKLTMRFGQGHSGSYVVTSCDAAYPGGITTLGGLQRPVDYAFQKLPQCGYYRPTAITDLISRCIAHATWTLRLSICIAAWM